MDIVALFYDLDKFAAEFEPLLRKRLLGETASGTATGGARCT